MNLTSILRRLHVFRQFDVKEISDAETENVLRDHGVAMTRMVSSNDGIRQSQGKLRESIQYVRATSESAQKADKIAQFVHDMRSSGPHGQGS